MTDGHALFDGAIETMTDPVSFDPVVWFDRRVWFDRPVWFDRSVFIQLPVFAFGFGFN